MSTYSKSINDSYYTPHDTVEQMYHLIGDPHLFVYDPCCGDGRLTNKWAHKIQVDLNTGHDFLSAESINEASAVVMNPPFSLDKQFVNKAMELADTCYSILPLKWSKISADNFTHYSIKKELLAVCTDNHFNLPDGSTRFVRCGIYKFTKVYDQCFINRSKLLTKSLLNSFGIQWFMSWQPNSFPLRTHGSGAGTWLDVSIKSHAPGTTRWLIFDNDKIKNQIMNLDLKPISLCTAGIPCFGYKELLSAYFAHCAT